jgi:hypothetical protein
LGFATAPAATKRDMRCLDRKTSTMDEPSTCGEGLAARSVLPAKFGELLAAQARILEAHVRALDPEDVQRDMNSTRTRRWLSRTVTSPTD